jgi:O-antigen ligase
VSRLAPPLGAGLPTAGTIAAIVGAGLVALGVLVPLMRRHADALPLLAIFALPFRVPIATQGRTVNLLIPLYVVVAAGTIAHLIPRIVRERDGRQPGAGISLRNPSAWLSPRGVELLLFASIALYAVQSIYSSDAAKAAENIAFFYLPFALLFLLLREVHWTRELLLRCLGIAVALGVLFAGIGFVEYFRKSLFLNPRVVQANAYDNYFRVNSVFFDPNIYGRFLALVMSGVTTAVLWARRRREALIGAGVLVWLLGGLVTSFSQSSIAALLLALVILAAWRWDVRGTAYAALGLAALGGALLLLAPASLHFGLKGSGGSTSNATSGRTKLISGGLELFADRPLQGFGSGSFETEYRSHSRTTAQDATSASHTIPITVAAEQGVLGLALYVALLIAAFFVLFRGAGRSPPRIALAACFAALVLHTWTYADFLEDPFTWTLLAIGVALAREQAPVRRVPSQVAF